MKVSGITSVQLFTTAILTLFLIIPFTTFAEECAFSQTLDVGVVDESVRCLQVYLNENGYQLAEEGPGSPGSETNKYGALTKTAVSKWQEDKGVTPTMGIFGPKSQAMYKAELLRAQVAQLEAETDGGSTVVATTPTPQPLVAGASTDADGEERKGAEVRLKDVMKMILDTYDEMEDERDDEDEEVAKIDEDLRDVIENLFAALELFFDGDYEDAEAEADEALDDATEAFEDAGGESKASEAKDEIEDAEDLYDEVALW